MSDSDSAVRAKCSYELGSAKLNGIRLGASDCSRL